MRPSGEQAAVGPGASQPRMDGVDPLVTVAANASGGVCGKMISPQSLSVATAAVGLVGHEADILHFTLKHSLILTTVIGIFAFMQAYLITWIIPVTKAVAAAAPAAAVAAAPAYPTEGVAYLGITAAAVFVIVVASRVAGKAKQA